MILFSEDLESSPRRALFDNGVWRSYAGLSAEVGQLAALLPRTKSLAFCFCRTDFGTVVNYLACLEGGHAIALLDAALHPAAKRDLIEHYRPELLLSTEEQADTATGYAPVEGITGTSRLWVQRTDGAQAPHTDLAVLLSTSGTTGSPKFARLSVRNIVSNADSIRSGLAIGAEDRAMASLPFHYSYGLSVLNSHLRSGAALALTTDGPLSPQFWNICRQAECTSMAGVPYSYQIFHRLNLDSLNVPSLKTMTQAGGALAPELIREFHGLMARRGGRFFVMYGQTEATARMAILPHQALPARLGSAGLPIPGGSFSIETEDGSPALEPNVRGELVYRGSNVMMGYATGREDLSLGDELKGELHTGDMCYLDEGGFLFVAGRMKRDAKVAGLRINLDEVEAMLKDNGPTAAVAGSNKILIYCEYGDRDFHARLRSDVARRLNLNHNALEFRRIAALPLNSNGKIKYSGLAEHDDAQ